MMTSLDCLFQPSCLKNSDMSFAVAVRKSLSSARMTKSPPGIIAFPSRFAAQIRTFALNFELKFLSSSPTRSLVSSTLNSTSSTFPFENSLTLIAEGKRSIRLISSAASYCGLTKRLMPKSFSLPKSSRYSGFETRAIVFFAPRRFAMMQQRIFSSSWLVAPIKSSAYATFASLSTSALALLPMTPFTSNWLTAFSTLSPLMSTTTTLCPSSASSCIRVVPTAPKPLIIMSIAFLFV